MKFRVGDRVRIREYRPEFKDQGPGFLGIMKDLCGEEFIITTNPNPYVSYKGWNWHTDWLEPVNVETEAEFDIDSDAFESILKIS